jgi:hypothetical protein
MTIYSVEDKTKRELVEIVKIQIEEYQKLDKENQNLRQEQENHEALKTALHLIAYGVSNHVSQN